MKKAILLGLLLVSCVGYSQNEGEIIIETNSIENEKNKVYTAVEIDPEYPGGINAFREFIAQNYKTSKVPKDLKESVIVNLVVETDGSLSDIEVLRDLGFGTGKEAIRVLKKSKK